MNKVPDYVPDKYKHKMFAMNMGVNGTEKSAEDVPSSDSSLLPFLTHGSVSIKALPNKTDKVDRVCRTCGVMQTIEVIQGQTPRCNMAGCLSTKLDFIPEDEAHFKPVIESTETIETEYDYLQYLEHLENTRRLGAQTSIEPVIDEHGKVVGTTVDFDYSGVRNLPSQIATAKAVASMKPCPSDCKREFDMYGRPHVCIVEEEKNSFVPKGYRSWQQYKKIQSFLNIWLSTPPTLFQRNVCKKHLGVDPTGFTEQQLTKHMKAYFWAKNNGKTELMAQKERIIKSNHEPVDNSLIWNIKEDYKPFAKRKDYDPINLDELDGWDSKQQVMTGYGESDIFGSVKYPTFVPNKYSRYNIKNDLLLTATMTGVKKNPKGEWVLDKDGKPVFKESKWAKTQTPSLSLSSNKSDMKTIFVFGSNLAGIHGAGAALDAKNYHGAIYTKNVTAKYGVRGKYGVGLQGNSYAIPTKNEYIRTRSLNGIAKHVDEFIEFAKTHPEMTFNVCKIGCGLAGYTPKDIAPLFKESIGLSNVKLPKEFIEVIL